MALKILPLLLSSIYVGGALGISAVRDILPRAEGASLNVSTCPGNSLLTRMEDRVGLINGVLNRIYIEQSPTY